MLQQFSMDLRLQKSGYLWMVLVQLGAFLFGAGIMCIIMRVDGDPGSWFCMGTLFSLLIAFVFPVFAGGFGYSGEFQLALSMGRTRTAFMGSYALRLLLQVVLAYAVTLGLYGLELAVYPLLFRGLENETAFTFLTNWKIVLPVMVGILVLSMFIGALYGRYGKKGMWVFYFLWLFCCFVLPRMFDDDRGDGVLDRAAIGVLQVFHAVPLTAWLVLAAVLAAGMVAFIIQSGRKQMVKL